MLVGEQRTSETRSENWAKRKRIWSWKQGRGIRAWIHSHLLWSEPSSDLLEKWIRGQEIRARIDLKKALDTAWRMCEENVEGTDLSSDHLFGLRSMPQILIFFKLNIQYSKKTNIFLIYFWRSSHLLNASSNSKKTNLLLLASYKKTNIFYIYFFFRSSHLLVENKYFF